MKDVMKAICVILTIIGLCAGAMLVLNRMGFGKRKYLIVEEN